MNAAPESALADVFRRVIDATRHTDDPTKAKRYTAVRWFNRLYYDVRRWNLAFIRFMRARERGEATSAAELDEYLRSLENPYGDVKNELCRNLEILTARFHKDFRWLRDEDPQGYDDLEQLLRSTYASEMKIIQSAHEVAAGYLSLDEYERVAAMGLGDLASSAKDAGIALLSVDEYEEALQEHGSMDPRVMVLGDVTLGDKISATHGIAIGRNATNVTVTANESFRQQIDLAQLADELASLRAQMKQAGTNEDHDIATAEVAKASKAAKEGDESRVIASLRSAGAWAFDVATKVGTTLAAAALKESLGIK